MENNQQLNHSVYAKIVGFVSHSCSDSKSTEFHVCLTVTFGGCARHGKPNVRMLVNDSKSQQVTMEASGKLSTNSHQQQNKNDKEDAKIGSFEIQTSNYTRVTPSV